ncbi:MAG: protein translocase subunit SecD, partial [Gammaproteobacteria bacterium]|nr:protein translocase subunit SecD [Gammaproteobacteria bacterium]
MNRYPSWLNALVLIALLVGTLVALPNIYGSAPAVQLVRANGNPFEDRRVERVVQLLEVEGIVPDAVYLERGRVIVRFHSSDDLEVAGALFREQFADDTNVGFTLAPKLPGWLRALGLSPMSLGLDLRGGVYVLLEVDMDSAVTSRLVAYEQDFSDRLRDARIRSRVEVDGMQVNVRLQTAEDMERTREIIAEADAEVLILDGADGRSLRVRMSEAQIKDRQDFAIEQNITTLRNRVDQLGVAEPLVQRQGANRIVVQLPGVQDPTQLDEILTATATLEFRMVDTTGDSPGSEFVPGRAGIAGQRLKREVIASGDQIIDAESGFDEGQPAVYITLDSAGGERMLANTQENLRKPMSTVFIETRREPVTLPDGTLTYRTTKTREIINTATIQGIFKDRFRTTGLSTVEARDLALLLRAGALAAPVFKVEDR